MPERYTGDFLIGLSGQSDSFTVSDQFLNKLNELYPSFQLLDKSSTFFYLFDFVKAKYLYVSDSISAILGYGAEEWKTKGVDFAFSIVLEDDVDRLKRCHKTLFEIYYATPIDGRKGLRYGFEARVRHKDGRVIWLLQQGVFIEIDEQGRPVVSFDVLSDVTSYKRNNIMTLTISHPENPTPQVLYFPLKGNVNFSSREIELLPLLHQGLTSKEIAAQLKISQHTVDTHRRNMIRKADVRDTAHLLSFAWENGLIG